MKKKLIITTVKLTEGQINILEKVYKQKGSKVREELQKDIVMNSKIKTEGKNLVLYYKDIVIEAVKITPENRDRKYVELYNKYF